VQKPVFEAENRSLVRSSHPVVSVNGEQTEPLYRMAIEAGDNTMVVVYKTYRNDYDCTFNWEASANTVYEVVSQGNLYPLTLFRWVRTNSLWASRLDPVDPVQCVARPTH
jgi:hypothetical protein